MKSKLRKKITQLIAKVGNARYCPICEENYTYFDSAGLIPRKNSRCIGCGSLERHRLCWLYFLRCTSIFSTSPKKFLHIAPEIIFKKKFASHFPDGTYLTADLLADDVDIKMDITAIQFPDGEFDFIYCSHVFEHIPDDKKAMREIHRVLSVDGTAILLVPITTTRTYEDPTVDNPHDREALYGQNDHVRRYGPDYQDRLSEAGFHVEKFQPSDFLSKKEIDKMVITKAAGDIFVCNKQ